MRFRVPLQSLQPNMLQRLIMRSLQMHPRRSIRPQLVDSVLEIRHTDTHLLPGGMAFVRGVVTVLGLQETVGEGHCYAVVAARAVVFGAGAAVAVFVEAFVLGEEG